MKHIALTLIAASFAVSFAAGAVSAAGPGAPNERPEAPARPTAAAKTITVNAGALNSTKEMQRAGLKATDKVSVTDVSLPKAKRTYER